MKASMARRELAIETGLNEMYIRLYLLGENLMCFLLTKLRRSVERQGRAICSGIVDETRDSESLKTTTPGTETPE